MAFAEPGGGREGTRKVVIPLSLLTFASIWAPSESHDQPFHWCCVVFTAQVVYLLACPRHPPTRCTVVYPPPPHKARAESIVGTVPPPHLEGTTPAGAGWATRAQSAGGEECEPSSTSCCLSLFSLDSARVPRTVRSPMEEKVIHGGGNARHHFLCLLQRARLSMNVFRTLIRITIIDFSLSRGFAASWQQYKRA